MTLRKFIDSLGQGLDTKQFVAAAAGMAAGFVLVIILLYLRYLVYMDQDFPTLGYIATTIGAAVLVASLLTLMLFGTAEQQYRTIVACLFAVFITIPAVILFASFNFDFT